MACVDELAVAEFKIDLLQMMELAGRHLAQLARQRFLAGDARRTRIIVLAGHGGNGGGGLAAARRLHGWGAHVDVFLAKPSSEFHGAAARQLQTLRLLNVAIHDPDGPPSLPSADLIVDALVGYRLHGAPTGSLAALIRAANAHDAPILSLDLPTGLDATSGQRFDPCVHATATLTLALPKMGLGKSGAHDVTGELYLADIAVPDAVFARLGIELGPLFAKDDLLRIG